MMPLRAAVSPSWPSWPSNYSSRGTRVAQDCQKVAQLQGMGGNAISIEEEKAMRDFDVSGLKRMNNIGFSSHALNPAHNTLITTFLNSLMDREKGRRSDCDGRHRDVR